MIDLAGIGDCEEVWRNGDGACTTVPVRRGELHADAELIPESGCRNRGVSGRFQPKNALTLGGCSTTLTLVETKCQQIQIRKEAIQALVAVIRLPAPGLAEPPRGRTNSEYFIIRVTCSCMCFETWLASSGEPASAARSGRILNDRAANFESIDVGLRTQGQTSCSWRFLQREPELKVVGAFRGEGGQFSICSERLVRVSDKRALTRNARPVIFGSFLDYST